MQRQKKFRVVDVFDSTVEEVIVREDNTFIDANGRWYYQSVEKSVEEPIEEIVEEPIEQPVEPIQEVAVIPAETTLEDSGDISEVIPDALEFTLDTPLPEVSQAVTLTKVEFRTKWGMIPKTVEGDRVYGEACSEAINKGYWTAPDGFRWTRTGKGDKALWTQETPVTV